MDGWQQALAELARYFDSAIAWDGAQAVVDRSLALSGATIPEAARHTVGAALESASTLGRRTAELHLALATEAAKAAFGSEASNTAWVEALAARAKRQLDTTVTALASAADKLPSSAAALADTLVISRERLNAVIDDLATGIPAGLDLTRIHGAFDLGQVLLTEGDYVIIDLEGDPALPMDERRRLNTPVRDVANMIRSFQYAAGVGLTTRLTLAPQDGDRISGWARWWHTWTTVSFLNAYRTTAAGAAFMPADTPAFEALLKLLLIEQSLTEIRRELDARPEYVWIPLRSVVELS